MKLASGDSYKSLIANELKGLSIVQKKLNKYKDLLENPSKVKVIGKSHKSQESILCHLCKKYFLTQASKDHHFKLEHATKYKCPLQGCSSKFCTKQNLDAHVQAHNKKI